MMTIIAPWGEPTCLAKNPCDGKAAANLRQGWKTPLSDALHEEWLPRCEGGTRRHPHLGRHDCRTARERQLRRPERPSPDIQRGALKEEARTAMQSAPLCLRSGSLFQREGARGWVEGYVT